nr:hypothetical protein CoNPh38_CDS0307 [Staphylococcus phage S-CoN_Ph38]
MYQSFRPAGLCFCCVLMTVTTLHPFQDYCKGFYKLFYFLFFLPLYSRN